MPFIDETAAAALARAMLCDVWSVVERVKGVAPILAAAEPGPFAVEVPAERFWLQPHGDLGSRIEHILQRALLIAPGVIALGADSPLLTPAHLEKACDCLHNNDAVLGPAYDRGFYLLAVRDCPSGLLRDICWSSQETCSETEHRIRSYGMTSTCIQPLFDVDTIADLTRLRNELEYLPLHVAPETRKWLAENLWSAS